jgi:ATP-binding cassette subfamily F protein 3
MKGEVKRAGKLRIGYFSQHQTDELDVNATPYQEMAALMRDKNPDVKDHVVRAKLAAFGFTRDLADNRIATLSGGEKARLLFAFMSFDGPHLLILDEPTNHLDIDAREALVQALNAYEGAIIIVSHDPTMVERVADRLWLVRDGAVQDFDGDLEDYRRFTIQAKRDAKRENVKENKDKKAKAQQAETAPVKSKPGKKELSKMEHEIARLTVERARLEALLADTAIYQNPKEASAVQADYQKVCGQLEQMESKWLAAHDDDAA